MGRSKVLDTRPRGVTIAQLMMVVAAVAAIGWVARADPTRYRWEQGFLIAAAVLLVARVLILIQFARVCPACGEAGVSRVAAVPFGAHYFHCRACGQRMKRVGLGKMWDASGPRDARHFDRGPGVQVWGDAPILPDDASPETRTVGRLLRGKLDRGAAAPEPVAVPGEVGWRAPAVGTADEPERSRLSGIKAILADRVFRTLEAIRWSRSRRS